MHRRLLKPLSEWTASDVQSLIDERVAEGQRLEYKRELNLDTQSQRREAAKDVSGMANASGGLLLYGVEEDDSEEPIPTARRPMPDGSGQARLEDVLDSSVSPTLNLQTRLLDAPDGGFFLIVRIFQRTGAPHMVESYSDHRHYVRSGIKTRPMKQEELRAAYAQVSHAEELVTGLVSSLPVMPRIARLRSVDDLTRPVGLSHKPWASVVTAPFDAPERLLSRRRMGRRDFPAEPTRAYHDVHLYDGAYRTDGQGYLFEEETGNEQELFRRLRLYRSGVCEWGRRYARDDYTSLPGRTFTQEAYEALSYFARVYAEAGYHGRVRVWVRVDSADHGRLQVTDADGAPREGETGHEWVGLTEDTNVDTLLDDPMPLVHHAMDTIWQGYGFDSCWLFSAEGEYR